VFQKHKNTKLLINNLQFKWCRIFTMHSLLFILSYFTVDELCKIFFFQFDHKFFLSDFILIKEQLILNSYEIVELEEEGPK
jgi:hypothetical protein